VESVKLRLLVYLVCGNVFIRAEHVFNMKYVSECPLTELGGVEILEWTGIVSETIAWTIQTKRIIKRQKNPIPTKKSLTPPSSVSGHFLGHRDEEP
jgi:hypothetical protein